MKKTKINLGAILLIVYALFAYLLSYAVTTALSSSFNHSYQHAYRSIHMYIAEFNSIFLSPAFLVTLIIIAFSIVLLAGKKWGVIAMGGAMATVSLLNALPVITLAGTNIINRFEWNIIIFILAFIIFVVVPAILGWLFYGVSGVFATLAQDNKKIAIIPIILKIVSAVLVALSGLNQIIFIALISIVAYGANYATVSFFNELIVPYGFVTVLALVAILILAAGIILSVKCLEGSKVEEKGEKIGFESITEE